MVKESDVVIVALDEKEIEKAVITSLKVARSIEDRPDLHKRDYLERFLDVLLGEIAERMVITWFHKNKKKAESAVNKNDSAPDLGHDLWLTKRDGKNFQASVKSSIAGIKSNIPSILKTFTMALKESEIRDINIQVYFWLSLYSQPRFNIPSLRNSAIIAWATRNDLLQNVKYQSYKGENRKAPNKRLYQFRPMKNLLNYLS